jgi:pseudoazurin
MSKFPGSLSILALLVSLPAIADKHVIHIFDHTPQQSMVFEPFVKRVKVGDTVEFLSDSPGHVTRSVFVPEGANEWQGKAGETVSVVLNKEGVYIYECVFHGRLGMAGVIQAGEASNLEQARAFFADYRTKFILYKDRLDPFFN